MSTIATTADIEERVTAIFTQITGIPAEDIARDKRLSSDLQIDSLTLIEVAVSIQDELSIDVPDENLKDLSTVGDVIDLVVAAQQG